MIISRSYATGDLNADGHLDLVISAPGYGSPGSPQEGRVYIIYGKNFYTRLKQRSGGGYLGIILYVCL